MARDESRRDEAEGKEGESWPGRRRRGKEATMRPFLGQVLCQMMTWFTSTLEGTIFILLL